MFRKKKLYAVVVMKSFDHNGLNTPYEITGIYYATNIDFARKHLEKLFNSYTHNTSSANEENNMQTYATFGHDRFTITYEPVSCMAFENLKSIKCEILDAIRLKK